MSPAAIAKVRALEAHSLAVVPQVPIVTYHLLHAGMYHRTITIPKNVTLTGALIKRRTTLTLCGDAVIYTGGEADLHLAGYHVIAASAGRKQAFHAIEDTHLTMCFPSSARTVAEAEAEFTDEAELLFSRRGENVVTNTGE